MVEDEDFPDDLEIPLAAIHRTGTSYTHSRSIFANGWHDQLRDVDVDNDLPFEGPEVNGQEGMPGGIHTWNASDFSTRGSHSRRR